MNPTDPTGRAHRPPLEPGDLLDDPIAQFRVWLDQALAAGLPEPTAIALATVDAGGAPSVRMVLLKQVDAGGFTFHTNYEGRKGRELEATGRAAFVIYWASLDRQIRVEGSVTRATAAESDDYFKTRTVASRLSAIASPQSRVIAGRQVLEDRVRELVEQHRHGEPERPAFWGGYRLAPDVIEFWQAGVDRLHDRLRYRRDAQGWIVERLAP